MESVFDEECKAAEAALDAGDLSHAAHHLAVALCHRTLDPGLQALVERFATDAPSSLAAIPEDSPRSVGTDALRAFCLGRLGRGGEAFKLVCTVAAHSDRKYLRWARPWLVPLAATIDPQEAALAFFSITGVALHGSDTKALVTVLKKAHAEHPEHGLLFFALFCCLRDRVSTAEAGMFARARVTKHSDAFTQLALASVHRLCGDLESSLRHYRAAANQVEHQPAPWLDVGDLLLELKRENEALEAYERTLDDAPADAWALPSALYLRAKLHGDPEARAGLIEYLADEPSNARARTVASWLAPFEAALPRRPEACVPIRRVDVQLRRFPRVGFGGLMGGLATEGRTGLRPPHPLCAARIGAIAARHFDPDVWWGGALDAAQALGRNARAVALATMVNPPPNPSPAERLADWVFAVQVAGALVIARSETTWAGSRRRVTLRDIVAGPVDWVVTAALYAIAEIGLREPDARADCMEILREARGLRAMSPVVWMCLAEPALQLLLRFPDLPAAQRAQLEAERERVANPPDETATRSARRSPRRTATRRSRRVSSRSRRS